MVFHPAGCLVVLSEDAQELAMFATVNGLLSKLSVSPFSLPFSALIVSPFEVLNRSVYTVYIVVKRFQLIVLAVLQG